MVAGLAVTLPRAGRRAVKVGVNDAVEGLLEVDVNLHLSLAAVEVGAAPVQVNDVTQLVKLNHFAVQPVGRVSETIRRHAKRGPKQADINVGIWCLCVAYEYHLPVR